MSETKDQPNWLKEAKYAYRDITEDLEAFFIVIGVIVLVMTAAAGGISLVYGFSWHAYLAAILSFAFVIGTGGILFKIHDKFDTLNPFVIWTILFWTELSFRNVRMRTEEIEEWLTNNCSGFWCKTDQYEVYRFAKEDDAILAKMSLE